jgi:putative membrane protein
MLDNFSWQWSWHLWTTLILVLICVLYLLGYRQAHKKGSEIRISYHIAFFSGIFLAALVLLTPIDTIGRTQYLWIHIAQTITLTTICAPLLIMGCGWGLARPVLHQPVLRGIATFLTRPVVASLLFNIVFLLWHTPKILDATAVSPDLYQVMELSIFAFSLLNWYPLIGTDPELEQMSYPMQMLYAFVDGQPVDIFAFVLVFTDVPIYTQFRNSVGPHLPAYADQALAGALLLIPGLVDLAVMTPLFFRWLGQIERKTNIADQRRQEEEEAEEEEEEEEEISAEQKSF